MTLSGETELPTSIQGAVRNLKSAFVSAVTTEGRCGRMKCVGGGDGPGARSAKGKVLENSIDRKVRRPIADDGDLIYLIFCRRLRAHELTVPAHHRGKFAMRPIMRSDRGSRIVMSKFRGIVLPSFDPSNKILDLCMRRGSLHLAFFASDGDR